MQCNSDSIPNTYFLTFEMCQVYNTGQVVNPLPAMDVPDNGLVILLLLHHHCDDSLAVNIPLSIIV